MYVCMCVCVYVCVCVREKDCVYVSMYVSVLLQVKYVRWCIFI